MRFTARPRRAAAAAIALAGSVLVFGDSPAAASTTIVDPSGVDYDAACIANTSLMPPPGHASPGGTGCPGVSAYDGSTETTDIASVSLAATASGLAATCTVDDLPPPGAFFPGADGPADVFNRLSCKVLFQNHDKHTNMASAAGGCTRPNQRSRTPDWHGHWKDGYHSFIGFDVTATAVGRTYRVFVGEYDPSPVGGFVVTELGRNHGGGWIDADPHMPYGTWSVSMSGGSITVTVDGLVRTADDLCDEGYFTTAYATPGDRIRNVKGIRTAELVARIPVTLTFGCGPIVPGSCGTEPLGGFARISDVTAGISTPGLLGTNRQGVAYTSGLFPATIGTWSDALSSHERFALGRRYGVASMPDTLGDGPTCPWPTLGGLLPQNPLYTPDTACHIDDDPIARGSFLPELWQTDSGIEI